ncbi:MAG: hypothetical protein ACTSRW_05445 [Candidatus Helarchaeota archaeon]
MLSIKKSDTLSLLIISYAVGHNVFTIPLLLTFQPYQDLLLFFLNVSYLFISVIFICSIVAGLIVLGFLIDKANRLTFLIQLSYVMLIIVLISNLFLSIMPLPLLLVLLFLIIFGMFLNFVSSLSYEINFISLGLKKREGVIGICLLTVLLGFSIASIIYSFIGAVFYVIFALIAQILLGIFLAILNKLNVDPVVPEKIELSKKVFIYFIAWISILIFCILGTDVPSLYTNFLSLQFNIIDLAVNACLLIAGILISVFFGRKLSFIIPFMLFAVHILLYSLTLTNPIARVVLLYPLKILEMLTIGSIFPNVFLVFSYLKAKDRAKYFSVFICTSGLVAVLSLFFFQPFLFINPVITLFVLFLGIIPINFLLQSGVLTETETEETLSYLSEAKKMKRKMRN